MSHLEKSHHIERLQNEFFQGKVVETPATSYSNNQNYIFDIKTNG